MYVHRLENSHDLPDGAANSIRPPVLRKTMPSSLGLLLRPERPTLSYGRAIIALGVLTILTGILGIGELLTRVDFLPVPASILSIGLLVGVGVVVWGLRVLLPRTTGAGAK